MSCLDTQFIVNLHKCLDDTEHPQKLVGKLGLRNGTGTCTFMPLLQKIHVSERLYVTFPTILKGYMLLFQPCLTVKYIRDCQQMFRP